MPNESDEPLRKCTLNLFRSDVEWLENAYGRGWTEEVRNIVRLRRQRLKEAGEMYEQAEAIRRITGV